MVIDCSNSVNCILTFYEYTGITFKSRHVVSNIRFPLGLFPERNCIFLMRPTSSPYSMWRHSIDEKDLSRITHWNVLYYKSVCGSISRMVIIIVSVIGIQSYDSIRFRLGQQPPHYFRKEIAFFLTGFLFLLNGSLNIHISNRGGHSSTNNIYSTMTQMVRAIQDTRIYITKRRTDHHTLNVKLYELWDKLNSLCLTFWYTVRHRFSYWCLNRNIW